MILVLCVSRGMGFAFTMAINHSLNILFDNLKSNNIELLTKLGNESSYSTELASLSADTMAEQDLSLAIKKADELWRTAEAQIPSDHTPVYTFLQAMDAQHPESVAILWRFSRACKDMSETETFDYATRKQYAYQGKSVALRAVQVDPNVWQAQMFLGALLGVCSRFELWHKLGSAREMKDCFEKACQLAGDTTPEPHHCLGAAEFGFAEAGRAARLMGLKGSFEGAHKWFAKAESLCPHDCYSNQGGHYNRNWLMIVKSLNAMGRKDEAKEWLEKLLHADVHTPDDRAALAEAKTLKIT